MTASDPPPKPPRQPDSDECCHGGCTFCVLDLYQDELDQYRQDLLAWQARQPAPTRRKRAPKATG